MIGQTLWLNLHNGKGWLRQFADALVA